MINDIADFFFCFIAKLFGTGAVYRLVEVKTGVFKSLLDPESVEFEPCIFPGVMEIGDIGVDLVRINEETLGRIFYGFGENGRN